MKLEYIDMPDVFRNTDIGHEFINALNKTSMKSLFNIKTV